MSMRLMGVITVIAWVRTTAACSLRGCHYQKNARKPLPTFKYNWVELKHCSGTLGIGGLPIGDGGKPYDVASVMHCKQVCSGDERCQTFRYDFYQGVCHYKKDILKASATGMMPCFIYDRSSLSVATPHLETNHDAAEPATTNVANEPATDSSIPEPATDEIALEPATNSSVPEPATNSSVREPATNSSVPEPAADNVVSELARNNIAAELARDNIFSALAF